MCKEGTGKISPSLSPFIVLPSSCSPSRITHLLNAMLHRSMRLCLSMTSCSSLAQGTTPLGAS